jgi:hypothetical protein
MKKISFVVDFVIGDDEDFSAGVAGSRIEANVRDLTKHYAVVFKGEKPMDSHGMKVWSKRCAGISLAAVKPPKKPKPVKAEAEQEAVPA